MVATSEMTWLWRHYPQHYSYYRKLRERKDVGPLLDRWAGIIQNFDELKHPPDTRLLNAWMIIFYDAFQEGLMGSPLGNDCAGGCTWPYCACVGRGAGLDDERPY